MINMIAFHPILCIIPTVLIIILFRYLIFIWKLRKIPSAPGSVPLFGHFPTMLSLQKKHGIDSAAAFHRLIDDTSKNDKYIHDLGLFKIWLGPYPIIILTSPETVGCILKRSSFSCPKSFFYKIMDIGILGLINNNGLKWKTHRKLLSSSFDSRAIEDIIPSLSNIGRQLVKELSDIVETNEGIIEDLSKITYEFTFKILYESVVGFDWTESNYNRFDIPLLETIDIVIKRGLNPLFFSDTLFKMSKQGKRVMYLMENVLSPFAMQIVSDKLKYRKEHGIGINNDQFLQDKNYKTSFLDLLIDANEKDPVNFTEEDIFGEFKTFFIAGFDTTANSIGWFIQTIGCHPEIQTKIHKELDDIFSDDPDRDPTMNDYKRMTYLDSCIKESMRLITTVPFISRSIADDTGVEINSDITLPKGTAVFIYTHCVHLDRNHWKDPLKFDPGRFSKERHPYSFIPFSSGQRNCLGKKYVSMKQLGVLSSILRNFTITSLQTNDEIVIEPAVAMKPKSKLRIKLTKRQRFSG